jgi:hypothetical protein
MKPEDVTLLIGILSPIASAVTTLTVLLSAPRLNFRVWKKQRLREQQLQVADKFAKLSANFFIHMNLQPVRKQDARDNAKIIEGFTPVFEQNVTFTLIGVLFEHPRTLEKLDLLKQALEGDNSENTIRAASRIRSEIAALLYAEALERPMLPFANDASMGLTNAHPPPRT